MARLVAKGIDFAIVLLLALCLSSFGAILGIFYLSFADALVEGYSVGKRFIGLSVVSLVDGKPCTIKQSFIRNLPFIIPLFLAIIPFWGWILAAIIGLPLTGLELYLLFTLDSGHRLGDVMADTTVIANDPHRMDLRKKKDSWFETENPLHL